MIGFLTYLNHILFSKTYSSIFIGGTRSIDLDCLYLNKKDIPMISNTIYLSKESREVFSKEMLDIDIPLTLILENKPLEHLFGYLSIYTSFRSIDNLILLPLNVLDFSGYKNVVKLFDIFKNTNMYVVNPFNVNEFKRIYNNNRSNRCVINNYDGKSIATFLIICILFILFLLFIYRIIILWNIYRNNKEQVIPINRLSNNNVYKYLELNFNLKNSDTCLICMELYANTDDVRVLCCQHFFHVTCVDPWLTERSAKCPLCRRILVDEI